MSKTYLLLKQSDEEIGCRVHNLILYNRKRKYAINTDDCLAVWVMLLHLTPDLHCLEDKFTYFCFSASTVFVMWPVLC